MIATPIEGYVLKKAEIEDVPLILSFIKELADYEKMEKEVTADEQLLSEHLFGNDKAAEVIFGYEQQKPVSFALFFQNFSTFLGKPGIYLEDLFVRPEYRGRGYGRTILIYLAKLTEERRLGRLEWACLDWNQPSLDFYASLGARKMEDWVIHRLTGKDLSLLATNWTKTQRSNDRRT